MQVIDFQEGTNQQESVIIKSLPWPVGEFKLDKKGARLVVVSKDGLYIFVYSLMYNESKNPEPI